MSYLPNANRLIGKLTSANFNSTADQAIKIDASKYIIRRIIVTNASTSLTLAAGGVYDAASKGGNAVVGSTQIYTGLTGSTKYTDLTLASILSTDTLTAATLYFALTTGQGGAASADIYIFGEVL